MKIKTKGAAKTAFNLDNLKRTADYYRANSWRWPVQKTGMPIAVWRRIRPVVERMVRELNLTPTQARSVLLDVGLQKMLGIPVPGRRAAIKD
jgi:hypothetical protein